MACQVHQASNHDDPRHAHPLGNLDRTRQCQWFSPSSGGFASTASTSAPTSEWAGDDPEFPELRWRFNACFDERSRAEAEGAWYRERGYSNVDLRCRTTRYQAQRHVTTS